MPATPAPYQLDAPYRLGAPRRPGARARRPLAVLGVLLAALLCALGIGAQPAAAHAALTGTDPAKGTVLKTAPERVTLTFSEGVLLSDDSVRVLDPRGERVDEGEPSHVDGKSSTATVRLRGGLPTGTFTVAWPAVSEDSHPVGGAFTFSIGAPSATSVTLPSAEPDDTVAALYDLARYVAYGGFVLLVGGCVCAGRCHAGRAVQRVAATGWGALAVSTFVLLLLRGPYTTTGKGLTAAFDFTLVRGVLDTKSGTALMSRLLLLAAAAVCMAVLFGSYAPDGEGRGDARGARQVGGGGRGSAAGAGGSRAGGAGAGRRELAWGLGIGGALVAGGLAATWALAEHASVGIQRSLAIPVDIVHLLAVAVWLGGLVALLVALRTEARLPSLAVRRFSQLAFGSVVALVVTGVYQSWRQVGSWHALTDTEYGRWLLVKVGLVVLLVAVAGYSRRWTGRLSDGPQRPRKVGPAKAAAAASRAERAERAERASRADGVGGAGRAGGARGADGRQRADRLDADQQDAAARTEQPAGSGAGSQADRGEKSSNTGNKTSTSTSTGSTSSSKKSGKAAGAGVSADPAAADQSADPTAAEASTDTGSTATRPNRPEQPTPAPKATRPSQPAQPDPSAAPPHPTPKTARPGRPDSVRAAQLARQRAAASVARTRQAQDADPERSGLRRSVALETSVAVVLLAVTTVLTGTQPGRAETEQGAVQQPVATGPVTVEIPYDTGGPLGQGTAEVTLDPGRTGDNTLHAYLTNPAGKPADVPELKAALTLRDKGIGPLGISLNRISAGHWSASGVQLPMPGDWQLSLTVRTSDIDQVTETDTLKVGP
ncbi:copper resistance protein CopC [Streptomyces sp. HSW2009]|uniref:copper resistance protein CopC n=1 Tax=Streptomyces sp. HSW2009 TaxID=3142890 RepID=UPI0032EE0FCE